ncbi:histidine kinase [Microbaculum marinum]|uniref:Histidine kinase n=1 Tax=Microbaculum marinum TaxID=1764581 RepID=A0AAW9RN37_9HYPH
MPSLFRFLVIVGFLVGLVYATMFALVTFVEPQPREISVRVPAERLQP